MEKERKVVYLASPYKHKDKKFRKARYKAVCMATAAMMKHIHEDPNCPVVFSPIAHTRAIAIEGNFNTENFKFFEIWDKAMIRVCDEVWVLQLEGWEKSEDIIEQIKYAKEMGKPVEYISLDFVKGRN